MDDGLMPVLIVAIVCLFVSFSVYIKYRTEYLKSWSGQLRDENIALKAKALELEGRFQVLEPIVINKNFKLDEEINSLAWQSVDSSFSTGFALVCCDKVVRPLLMTDSSAGAFFREIENQRNQEKERRSWIKMTSQPIVLDAIFLKVL